MGVNNGSPLPTLPDILEQNLRILNAIPDSELNPNEKLVAKLIARIPYGKIASYGKIAEWAESKYQYTGGNARVVANIRGKIYGLIEHYTDFPLWRLASQQDDHAANDSIVTRIYGMEKRIEEGSWNNPIWFDPQKYFDPYQ
ncbi:MAG: MGMT family protein [Candidatus Competibacteraceae bacterium]|nr:MGMT family protein [Candidatus Competibacteraceae bacterium]